MEDIMLTTTDNPYNPKTQYDDWRDWDIEHGYNTEEYIARLIELDGFIDSDDEIKLNEATEKAIADILANDVTETYKVV